jgi:hypothetical protein
MTTGMSAILGSPLSAARTVQPSIIGHQDVEDDSRWLQLARPPQPRDPARRGRDGSLRR